LVNDGFGGIRFEEAEAESFTGPASKLRLIPIPIARIRRD